MEHGQSSPRHEHSGMSSQGDFDDVEVLRWAGLSKGQHMLDAGCGDGHFSLSAMGLLGDEGSVHAMDVHEPSMDSLRRIKQNAGLKNLVPLLHDLTKGIPLPSGSMDMVLLSNVLHGFVQNGEADVVLKELNRVLKVGGRVLIIEFLKKKTSFGPPIEVRLSGEEIGLILGRYGLAIEGEKRLKRSHSAYLFKKELGIVF